MSHLKLYHFPGACSRVTMVALEEAGCEYEDELVDFHTGAHTRPAYRAVNPFGKVPALLIDGVLLTENVAILIWLDQTYPAAGLLPQTPDPLAAAQQLSDLVRVSSMWHPYVRANAAPMLWTVGDTVPVRERGRLLLAPLIADLDTRLQAQPWYYGAQWSIIDMYLYWCYTRAEQGEFPLEGLPGLAAHRRAIEARPAFARAMAREAQSRQRPE